MHMTTGKTTSKESKYMTAIRMAANVLVPANQDRPIYRSPKFTSLSTGGATYSWGDGVRYPHYAMTAADVAAYAEHGFIEEPLTPYDLVSELLLLPSVLATARTDDSLRELCVDAIRRCSEDARFAGADAKNASALLRTLASS